MLFDNSHSKGLSKLPLATGTSLLGTSLPTVVD